MGFVMQANETVIKSQGEDDYGKIVALGKDGKLDSSVMPDDTVNQNAFSNVLVNGVTIEADSETDTLELAAGTNIGLTADATNEKVTIAVTGQVTSAAQADSAGKLGTARTISITGDASGSGSFDGSEDVSISVDVVSADTATKLEMSRTINGVSFDGSADITITAEANGGNADTATNATSADSATIAESCTGNAATATKLAAARTISLTGDATGSATFDGLADASIVVDVTSADSASVCTGNAATATKLETARTINGVSFDGSADITIVADADYDGGHLFSANGYQKLSNGLIIQWGRMVSGQNTFPIPFTTAAYRMVSSNRPSWTATSSSTEVFSLSTTGFYVTDFGVGDSWKIAPDYIVIGL